MPKPPPRKLDMETSPDASVDQAAETERAGKRRAVERGLADAAAGRVVAGDDVKAWVRSWGSGEELSVSTE